MYLGDSMMSSCTMEGQFIFLLADVLYISHKSVNILILTSANHGLFFTFAF